MFAVSLRDYQRQMHVATKRTTPALSKRRYSIDVNTKSNGSQVSSFLPRSKQQRLPWGSHIPSINSADHAQAPCTIPILPSSSRKRKYEELERVTPSTPQLPFPSPLRYLDFYKYSFPNPPPNNDIFLQIDNAEITNNEWWYITHTSGEEKWMLDNGLDMALKVLSCDLSCQAPNIAIASSIDSQVCYNPDPDGKDDYPERFGDKRWIFMPVNDGMRGVVNDNVNGVHWSVVALDRVHKSAHYYDSIFVNDIRWLRLAQRISAGMLHALGENLEEWILRGEEHSPCQIRDNQCEFDGGACAPIVYYIINMLISHICTHQQAGTEEQCSLELYSDFPSIFRSQFHSYHIRHHMQRSIGWAKMQKDAEERTCRHDWRAIACEDVEVQDEPPLRFDTPRKRPEDPIKSHYFDIPQALSQPAQDVDTDDGSALSGAVTIASTSSMPPLAPAVLDDEGTKTSGGVNHRPVNANNGETTEDFRGSNDEGVQIAFIIDEAEETIEAIV
jgi:hypothetical protein